MPVTRKMLEQSRIERMRMGQGAGEVITLPSNPELRFQIVPLVEREFQAGIAFAASIDAPETMGGAEMRDRAQMHSDLFNASRTIENLQEHYFEDIDTVASLDLSDINYIAECYALMEMTSSPSLDGLTDEDLDELKNGFATIEWSELDGLPWMLVKRCLSVILPQLLVDKLSGHTSTD